MELNKKTKKAITPVIALVMLLLITVGITGASYSWFGGLMSSQTKKPITIPPGGAYCADGDIKVYALNNGDAAITTQDIIVAQVDGVDVKGTPFFGDMRSGLVGYWKFDEAGGTTARDSSGNNNNGDLKPLCPNCPEWKTGRSRSALSFDGVNDYADFAATANTMTNLIGEFTISGWLIMNSLHDGHIINRFADGDRQYSYFVRSAVGTELACFVNDETTGSTSKETYADIANYGGFGAWIHMACRYNGTHITLFANGQEASSTQALGGRLYASSQPLRIGKYAGGAYFNGIIDEVKIYNKAVGEVSIQPSSSGLVVNYPGAEGRHTVRVGTSSTVAEASVTCA